MDWSDVSRLTAQYEDFTYSDEPREGNEACEVMKSYNYQNGDDDVPTDDTPVVMNRAVWRDLGRELQLSPNNGYCILFLPRGPDTRFDNPDTSFDTPDTSFDTPDTRFDTPDTRFDTPVPSAFTDLAISNPDTEYKEGDPTLPNLPPNHPHHLWRIVLELLYLPSRFAAVVDRGVPSVVSLRRHTQDASNIYMHMGTTSPQVTYGSALASKDLETTANPAANGFAFASTHFESRSFTSAVIVGCSASQIRRVRSLVGSFEISGQHPYLMLAIFAELASARLDFIINDLKQKHDILEKRLGKAVEDLEDNNSLGLAKGVLFTSDRFLEAQEEAEAVIRQLEKGCMQIDKLQGEYDANTKVTQYFSEQFHDKIAHLTYLSSQCRRRGESITLAAELFGNELAKREAKTSGQNTRKATVVAIVALVWLPITGLATILAMPIFGWMNDWKNLRFESVQPMDESDNGSPDSGSDDATSTGLPVVSGYIYIYIGVSVFLLILTFLPFRDDILKWLHEWRQKGRNSNEEHDRVKLPFGFV